MTRTRIGVNAAWVPAVYVYVALVVRRRGITSVAVITCSSWTTRNANSCHTTTNRYTNTAGARPSVCQSIWCAWVVLSFLEQLPQPLAFTQCCVLQYSRLLRLT